VLSRLVASAAAASAEVTALAAGVIFDAEAGSGVSSMACIIVIILCFLGPTAFFVAEGSSFFCKASLDVVPEDLTA
jgi:hypothetical protein